MRTVRLTRIERQILCSNDLKTAVFIIETPLKNKKIGASQRRYKPSVDDENVLFQNHLQFKAGLL